MQAGDIFDKHYRLIRELGTGGFSEVWLAEDRRVDSLKVALKIYTSAKADSNDVKTFIKQFELVYNINHTNLLPPNACGEFNGMLYLVLRYCERGSSYSLLGKINEPEAWNFLHDVASGLEYLHQKNIIHQDIKPDNVLITSDNRYVITDFDISAKARNTLRLGTSAPSGTSAYMSPERFGATPTPIKASDIWALGASLYELISANLPFGDLGGLNQKNGANFQPLKNSVSNDLKNIITLCLQIEPWNRPTAEEIKTWCDLHFKNKKIQFEKKYRKIVYGKIVLPNINKKILWIIGVAAVLAIICIIAMNNITSSLPKGSPPGVPNDTIVYPPPTPPDTTPPVDMVRFNRFKENAKKFFDSAQEMNDRDYYNFALNNCDSALSVRDDEEMKELKKKIESIIVIK
ncbi:MAG: serine/threonine protein kinase [Candidatus Azobacteroides sp.]|nr:serine/threonine protein kinase [Candidatus Azobacteroides sp.]